MANEKSEQRMNPEIKAKWVAALRSGEYKQGKEFLRHGDTFCCLGVLCDMYVKDAGREWRESTLSGGIFYCEGASGTLPRHVEKWAGIKGANRGPVVAIGGVSGSLSSHNDSGRSFAQIADAIEAQL